MPPASRTKELVVFSHTRPSINAYMVVISLGKRIKSGEKSWTVTKKLPTKKSRSMVVRPKGSRGRPQTSSVSIAPLSPPQRRNPLLAEKTGYGRKSCNPVAPIWRDNVALRDRAAWGALLRERKVTGRDASLPAPCWLFPLSSFDEQRLGRCPKPHKGRRPLTLQGGIPP